MQRVRRPAARRGHARDGWGWIDLTKLALANGGADLLQSATLMAPDDGNADDRTVLRAAAAPARAARRRRHARHRASRRSCRASSRATGYVSDYLPRRPVVPEAGRLRAGGAHAGARPAAGTATSSTPTPSSTPTTAASTSASRRPTRFVVGATGSCRARRANSGGTVTLPLRPGRRARLRVDGGSALRRGERPFIAAREVSRGGIRVRCRAGRPPARRDAPLRRRIRLLMQPAHMPQAQRYSKSRGRPSRTSASGTGAIPIRR